MTINLTDPANHPANSPLTGERIERVIEALEISLKYSNGSSMDHVLADAVKGLRELLVSREAEPVAYANPLAFRNFSTFKSGETDNKRMGREWMWANSDAGLIPLYAAPLAPVVDADLLHTAASAIEDLLTTKDRSGAHAWCDIPAKLRKAAQR